MPFAHDAKSFGKRFLDLVHALAPLTTLVYVGGTHVAYPKVWYHTCNVL